MKNTFAWLASAVLLSSSAPAAPTKPNIIVILTDDLGCQFQEKDVLTPHIDRFAKEGALSMIAGNTYA